MIKMKKGLTKRKLLIGIISTILVVGISLLLYWLKSNTWKSIIMQNEEVIMNDEDSTISLGKYQKIGDKLYFVEGSHLSVKQDGNVHRVLDDVSDFFIYKDTLFFTKTGWSELYRCDADKTTTFVQAEVIGVGVIAGELYIATRDGMNADLYRYNFETNISEYYRDVYQDVYNNSEGADEGAEVTRVIFLKDCIAYCVQHKVYTFNPVTKNLRKHKNFIHDIQDLVTAWAVAGSGNSIYYSTYTSAGMEIGTCLYMREKDPNNGIYCYNILDDTVEKVSEKSGDSLAIIGKSLYVQEDGVFLRIRTKVVDDVEKE